MYSETLVSYAGIEVSTGRYLSREWTWNGDKVTKYTSYNTDGKVESSYDFVYDGKVLTRLNSNDGSYSDFIYDGKKIQEIHNYENGELADKLVVTKRDGKKITQLTATIYGDSEPDKKQLNAVLQMLMPESAAKYIVTSAEKHIATKGGERITTINFTWTGDNITKLTICEDSETADMFYTYDNMNNPHQGFLADFITSTSMNLWGSANNATCDSLVATYNGEPIELVNHYDFEYNDNWPAKRFSVLNYEGLSGVTTDEYEYND